MRARIFFACLLLWLAVANDPAHSAPVTPKPVTIQELTLLLHGGYTGDEVLRETAGRPLLEPLDAAAENTLRAAGADSRLLEALKATRPALTSADAAAARQQQTDLAARTAEGKADYVSRMYVANKQEFEAQLAVRKQASLGRLADDLRGQLVVWRDGRLQPSADDAVNAKKLFAFYYVSARSRPCRQFTSTLLKFYRDFAPKHPAFEVVLISLDKTPADLESALHQDEMPWPALAFDRRTQLPGLMKFAEGELPRLVLIDGLGRVVADSYVDGKYVGPQHVLDALVTLAAAGAGNG